MSLLIFCVLVGLTQGVYLDVSTPQVIVFVPGRMVHNRDDIPQVIITGGSASKKLGHIESVACVVTGTDGALVTNYCALHLHPRSSPLAPTFVNGLLSPFDNVMFTNRRVSCETVGMYLVATETCFVSLDLQYCILEAAPEVILFILGCVITYYLVDYLLYWLAIILIGDYLWIPSEISIVLAIITIVLWPRGGKVSTILIDLFDENNNTRQGNSCFMHVLCGINSSYGA